MRVLITGAITLLLLAPMPAMAMAAPSPRWGVTAFVQDAKGRVWQSLNLPAAACSTDPPQ